MTAVIDEELVRRDLKDSSDAWNRGDIVAMCGYYASDARYLTSEGLVIGRGNILTRCKEDYPDIATMGILKLELEDFIPRIATATVRWALQYADGTEKTGRCTLIYELNDGGLQVVYDNSR